MAEKGENGSKKKGIEIPPGAVGALTFTGGALVGAAVLFGAKKLYDYMKSPKNTDESKSPDQTPLTSTEIPETSQGRDQIIPEIRYEDFCDEKPESPSEENIPESDAVSESSVKSSDAEERHEPRTVDRNLHDSLLQYYSSYVDITSDNMREAAEIVVEIKDRFEMYMQELLPNLHILGLHETGSAMEGLQVVRPEEFDINIILNIDPDVWEMIDAGQTILGAHGYWLIKRKNREFFTLGNSPFDKYMIGEYLSPNKVKLAFQDFTNRVGKWSSDWKVQANVIGTAVQLMVNYGNDKTLNIEFRPSIMLGNIQVIAKPHPQCERDKTFDNLWRQTFATQELEKMLTFRENGCQAMCLKILKAIRLNHPEQLGLLPSYVLKTAVLHFLDVEDEWSKEALSERFLDILKFLEGYLRDHCISHHFCPEENLLADINPHAQDMLSDFITHIIDERKFKWLLKHEY